MATFEIYQDSEKENPQVLIKEKILSSKTTAFQPSALHDGGAGGVFSDKQQNVRYNFSVLNNIKSNSNAQRVGGPSKVAFRTAGNSYNKINDVNIIYNAPKSTSAAAAVTAGKKSAVVPVVEQFKSFSVYEDQYVELSEQQNVRQNVATSSSSTYIEAVNANLVVEKENLYVENQRSQQQNIDIKCSDALHKAFNINEEDYCLDTTPMSVSEVSSPMSVDRSQITQSEAKLLDECNSRILLERYKQQQQQKIILFPRNDRERFFDVVVHLPHIMEYFRESEKKHRPKPNYMRRQNDINYSMRTILVDWLVEVSEEYTLDSETLYLSVIYIDRFLSHMSVVRSKLQLVGTAAMYIASKYEEIYPPDVNEFVFITDDTYNKSQVLRMEQIILKILAFDLCTPTAYCFVNAYSAIVEIKGVVKFLTQYICELSLLEAEPYLSYYPSLISSGSLALAHHILDYPIWSSKLEEVTTYKLEDLQKIILYLSVTHNAAATLPQQAIQEKYKSEKYHKVSTIKPIELNEEIFEDILRKYNLAAQFDDDISSASKNQATKSASNDNVRKMISQMFK